MPSPQLRPGPNDAHTLPQTFYMGKFGELLQNLIPTPIQPILSSVWEPPETDHTRRCQAGLQRGFDPTLSNDPKSNAQPLKFDPGRRICAPLRVGNPRHTGARRERGHGRVTTRLLSLVTAPRPRQHLCCAAIASSECKYASSAALGPVVQLRLPRRARRPDRARANRSREAPRAAAALTARGAAGRAATARRAAMRAAAARCAFRRGTWPTCASAARS